MKMESDIFFNSILKLNWTISHNLFKKFMKDFDLPDGINPTHGIAMMILHHNDSMSMSQLSTALNLEKGSFTTVANKLLNNGYIQSKRCASDKRKYLLSLTPKGQEFTNSFRSEHSKFINNLFSDLDNERKDLLMTSINNMISIFDEIGMEIKCFESK